MGIRLCQQTLMKGCWLESSNHNYQYISRNSKIKDMKDSANQRPGRPSCFSNRPKKHKLGRGRWDLASCQVSLNFVQRFQRRSRKCESKWLTDRRTTDNIVHLSLWLRCTNEQDCVRVGFNQTDYILQLADICKEQIICFASFWPSPWTYIVYNPENLLARCVSHCLYIRKMGW